MDELVGKSIGKRKMNGNSQEVMNSIKGIHYGVEDDEIYRVVAGNLAVENFGVRSAGLRVAARKTGCTFGISASRAMPAYIYTQGLEILEIRDILGNN